MEKLISEALLAWYRAGHRDLPWRRARDPYAIWVSEIMLQQTTVAAVVPYYERFLSRFPTVAALADAPLEDVLSHWSGLGYYSRARNLKAAAEKVARAHGGRVPATYDAIRALPGIGDYTAGAILSIAYGVAEPVLDGNVARVLARLFALEGDPKKTAVRRTLRETAARLLDRAAPGDFNQALMELGATVCTPRSPACDACPVARWCRAHETGRVAELPAVAKRAKPVPVRMALALVEEGGAYFMVRRTERLMKDLWEFPGGEVPVDGPVARPLAELVARSLDLPLQVGEEKARARHTIMNRKIELIAHEARPTGEGLVRARALVASGAAAFVPPSEIGRYGVSSIVLKVLAKVTPCGRPARARA